MPYAFQLAMIEWHPEKEEVAATILAFIQFDDNTPKDSDPFTNDPSAWELRSDYGLAGYKDCDLSIARVHRAVQNVLAAISMLSDRYGDNRVRLVFQIQD